MPGPPVCIARGPGCACVTSPRRWAPSAAPLGIVRGISPRIQAHLPLPEPTSREPAIGEVLAVLLGNKEVMPGRQALLPPTGWARVRRCAELRG